MQKDPTDEEHEAILNQQDDGQNRQNGAIPADETTGAPQLVPAGTPICGCGYATFQRTVYKQDSPNVGREFYVCANSLQNGGCGYYKWADGKPNLKQYVGGNQQQQQGGGQPHLGLRKSGKQYRSPTGGTLGGGGKQSRVSGGLGVSSSSSSSTANTMAPVVPPAAAALPFRKCNWANRSDRSPVYTIPPGAALSNDGENGSGGGEYSRQISTVQRKGATAGSSSSTSAPVGTGSGGGASAEQKRTYVTLAQRSAELVQGAAEFAKTAKDLEQTMERNHAANQEDIREVSKTCRKILCYLAESVIIPRAMGGGGEQARAGQSKRCRDQSEGPLPSKKRKIKEPSKKESRENASEKSGERPFTERLATLGDQDPSDKSTSDMSEEEIPPSSGEDDEVQVCNHPQGASAVVVVNKKKHIV